MKVDICINSLQKYKEIVFKGETFKVPPIHEIMYYKCKYAMQGNIKHINDVNNITISSTKITNPNTVASIDFADGLELDPFEV